MADILTYFGMAFTGINLLLALLGTVIGIVIGALPGFTPTMGIAVLIPVTYIRADSRSGFSGRTVLRFYVWRLDLGDSYQYAGNLGGRCDSDGWLSDDTVWPGTRSTDRGSGCLFLGRLYQSDCTYFPSAASGKICG